MSTNISSFVSTADLNLPLSELYRCMGYGESTPEEELCALCKEVLAEACEIARPSYHYSIFDCEVKPPLHVRCYNSDGAEVEFESGKTITGLMRRSTEVAIFVATAGDEFQHWIDSEAAKGDILKSFIIDSIGSMIVEAAGDYMESVIEKQIADRSLLHTNRFSPGYCGWNITEQRKLFGILPTGVCNISLGESCLMHPIKSISGFIGIGESVITKKYGCSICNKLDCYIRQAQK